MWYNVEEFRRWWWGPAKKPIQPPFENPVFFTDNAMSLCLFRKGNFQVELYISAPNGGSPPHTHPGVDSSFMHLTGNLKLNIEGMIMPDIPELTANPDGSHPSFGKGAVFSPDGIPHWLWVGPEGGAFLSFEHWKDKPPVSVTVNWNGEPVGAEHKNILDKIQSR